MRITSMMDLYVDQLQDMHSAETQLIEALPKMANVAFNPDLSTAFTEHLTQTKEQLERLDTILASLDKTPGRKVCKAAQGLVEEGAEMIAEDADEEVQDAALIVSAQKVEHYEIASYGCLRTFATLLGRSKDAQLHAKTLEEEKAADRLLTKLAVNIINAKAMA